jgi:hypothetical protein
MRPPQRGIPYHPAKNRAWLLNQALDFKREFLTVPLPDPEDDSPEAHRLRSLLLAAADSTIEQTIRLRTNQLAPAPSDDIGKLIEERRQKALEEIAGMRVREALSAHSGLACSGVHGGYWH